MNYFVLLLLIGSAWAYPQEPQIPIGTSGSAELPDFLDVMTTVIVREGWFGDLTVTNQEHQIPLKLNCIPESLKEKIGAVCMNTPEYVSERDITLTVQPECILVNLLKALNNGTGILDVNALKATLIDVTSLSTAEKKSAGDSLQSCIESEFKTPLPPPGLTNSKYDEINQKYTNQNHPKKALACAIKALLTNGCSNVPKNAAMRDMGDGHSGSDHPVTVNSTCVLSNRTSNERHA